MIFFPQAPEHIYRHLTLEICLLLNKPTGHCMRQPRALSLLQLCTFGLLSPFIRPCKIWLARQLELMDWWRVITNHDWVKEDILYAGQDWEGLVALAVVVLMIVTVYDNAWQCMTMCDSVWQCAQVKMGRTNQAFRPNNATRQTLPPPTMNRTVVKIFLLSNPLLFRINLHLSF